MTTHYSSDWHLGHKRIIELCDRPFASVEEMNEAIIENCNRVVKRHHRLILLGDNVLGSYAENVLLLSRIECENVVLLPGNHDRWSLAYHTQPHNRVKYRAQLQGMGFTVLEDKRPSVWATYLLGNVNADPVNISHYPYAGDSQEADRHLDMRPVDNGLPLIHGHVHTKWRENGRMLNVGVDVWDFTPVPEDTIVDWVASLPAS